MYGHTWVCKTHSNIIYEGDNFAKILTSSKEICEQIESNNDPNDNDPNDNDSNKTKTRKRYKYKQLLKSNKK